MTRRRRGERDKDPAHHAASDRRRRDDLEQLAGGIAHDFRNVLAVIKGNVEIAEQRSADPRVKSLLIEAGRAAELGAAMTDQLLAFAQRRRASAAPIDVAEALAAIAPMLRAAAEPAIDVTIAAEPDAGRISADRIEFERVMINLVANARAAMSAGGQVTLAAETAAFDAPRHISSGILDAARYVCISLTDRGAGMAPGVLARALDPFLRLSRPATASDLACRWPAASPSTQEAALISTPRLAAARLPHCFSDRCFERRRRSATSLRQLLRRTCNLRRAPF